MESKQLQMIYMRVDELIKYENNAKTHPDTQVDKIANSIRKYGFDQPISVDKNNIIIKGHGRLLAAKKLGLEHVPVIVRDDLTLLEAAASRIADNKVAESPWDEKLLPIELAMLEENGIDIREDIGFSNEDIEAIMNKNDFAPLEDEGEQGKLDEIKLIKCPACNHEFSKS